MSEVISIEDVIDYLQCKPNVADRLRKLNPRPLYVSDIAGSSSALRGYHPTTTLNSIRKSGGVYDGLGSVIRQHGREILDFIPPEYILRRGKRKYIGLAQLLTVEHFYYEAKEASEGCC